MNIEQNKDIAIVDLMSRQRKLGVISNVSPIVATVTGTGEIITFQDDLYESFSGQLTSRFHQLVDQTEEETSFVEKKRLISTLNQQWVTYINSDPPLENVIALAELIEGFNSGS